MTRLVVLALLVGCGGAQPEVAEPAPPAPAAPVRTLADLEGTWTVDLRPDLTSEPYTKPMVLKVDADKKVTGSFYESEILDGRASAAKNRVCVAFKTTDGSGLYQSSGCLVGDEVVGQTWSEERQFLLAWTAVRAR